MNRLNILISIFVILSLFLMSAVPINAMQNNYKKSKLININYANSETLTKLPGIGKKKAERIIKFRKKNGRFKRISDIMKINGIGEKTFKKFSKMIKV